MINIYIVFDSKMSGIESFGGEEMLFIVYNGFLWSFCLKSYSSYFF